MMDILTEWASSWHPHNVDVYQDDTGTVHVVPDLDLDSDDIAMDIFGQQVGLRFAHVILKRNALYELTLVVKVGAPLVLNLRISDTATDSSLWEVSKALVG